MKAIKGVGQPLLEQWALGELEEGARGRVEAALKAEGLDPAEVKAALARENAELLARFPFAGLEQRLPAKAKRRVLPEAGLLGRPWFPALAGGLVAAAAVAVFMVGAPRGPETAQGVAPVAEDGVRLKGGARLLLYRAGQDGSELLNDGAQAAPGDAIQVVIQADKGRAVAVYSVDGRGGISKHYPADGACSAAQVGNEPVTLPRGFILDAAPGFERFFLLEGKGALDCHKIEEAIEGLVDRKSGPLDAGEGVAVVSATLIKPVGGAK